MVGSHFLACGFLPFEIFLRAVHVIDAGTDLRESACVACAAPQQTVEETCGNKAERERTKRGQSGRTPLFFLFLFLFLHQPLNRLPKRRNMLSLPEAQAVFFRRRHQPRRPPLAKIRPGRPAPAMGAGTLTGTK
jgi:hypothetical protein